MEGLGIGAVQMRVVARGKSSRVANFCNPCKKCCEKKIDPTKFNCELLDLLLQKINITLQKQTQENQIKSRKMK